MTNSFWVLVEGGHQMHLSRDQGFRRSLFSAKEMGYLNTLIIKSQHEAVLLVGVVGRYSLQS